LRRANLLGQAEPFQLRSAAEHQAPHLGIVLAAWPQVGDTAAIIGDVAQRAVEAGPAVGFNLLFQGSAYFVLGAGTKFDGDALGRPVAKTSADIVAADDQVLTIVGAAADQDVDALNGPKYRPSSDATD
jgi:hypothetical protein